MSTLPEILQTTRELAGGLILRRSTKADAEKIAAFNVGIHGDERLAPLIQDLLSGSHPLFPEDGFTIVEEPHTGQIVSSLCLVPQTWSYGGIPFGVGRPELVGTLPDYRNRGLVRAQMDAIHAESEARSDLLQGITGIPYYYRLFGYEMAVDLDGGRNGYQAQVPALPEGQSEPYHFRLARAEDAAFVGRVYNLGAKRSLISCIWDEGMWRYEIAGKSRQNLDRVDVYLIETPGGDPVGMFCRTQDTWGKPLVAIRCYELLPGVSWAEVTPALIRFLWALGRAAPAQGKGEILGFGFWLGREHPAYRVAARHLPEAKGDYAYYMRIPDLPRFVRHIAPVLEARLAGSDFAGHTGALRVNFYNGGLKLSFTAGRLTAAEPWREAPGQDAHASFPGLTFLQLLLGYRSLAELDVAFPDCSPGEYAWLLETLFPKQASNILPII